MEIRRLRTLAVEISKTLNEINPLYRKNIFTSKENAEVRQNDIFKRINTSRFGTQSLKSLGPKIWNNLSSNIKSETSFLKFKEYIKTWSGPKCRCKVCISMWTENVLLFCIYLTLSIFYIYSYFYSIRILAQIWSVFMHGLYFFHFCIYADLLFFEDK